MFLRDFPIIKWGGQKEGKVIKKMHVPRYFFSAKYLLLDSQVIRCMNVLINLYTVLSYFIARTAGD